MDVRAKQQLSFGVVRYTLTGFYPVSPHVISAVRLLRIVGVMRKEIPIPDPLLTPEEQAKIEQLSNSQIQAIDCALLSHATRNWRKVAMIVGLTMTNCSGRISGIPDIFYASRVRKLVESGHLESEGDLGNMGSSEVRLPYAEKQSN